MASDSRVTGGERWDWSPKVLSLPRPGTVAAVAGTMGTAYAYLAQAIWTAQTQVGSADGRIGLSGYAAQVQSAIVQARQEPALTELPNGEDRGTGELMIAGWDWRRGGFGAYHYFSTPIGHECAPVFESTRALSRAYFMGSGATEARARLKARMKEISADPRHLIDVGWEPMEILQDMIDDASVLDVGGAPQIVRAYQYGASEPFLVERPDGGFWLGGRELGSRSDLRAVRFGRDTEGRLQAQTFFPEGLSMYAIPPRAAPWDTEEADPLEPKRSAARWWRYRRRRGRATGHGFRRDARRLGDDEVGS